MLNFPFDITYKKDNDSVVLKHVIIRLFLDDLNDFDVNSKIKYQILELDNGIETNITDTFSRYIETNNLNKTEINYQLNNHMGIRLYKTHVDGNNNVIKEYISQNINDLEQSYYYCNEVNNGYVETFLIQNYVFFDASSYIPYEYDTMYGLEFNLNYFYLYNGIGNVYIESKENNNDIPEQYTALTVGLDPSNLYNIFNVSFSTIKYQKFLEQNIYSDLVNNSIYRKGLLPKLNDSLYILSDKCKYDLNFQFESAGKTIQIDTQKQLEELYLKQYMPEYYELFSFLDSFVIENPNKKIQLLNLKQSLYNKSNLLHYTIKGTVDGIRNLIYMFANIIGNYIVIIEENDLVNFNYTITSNMPILYWEKYLKPIVHPLSWTVNYIYIDSNIDLLTNISSINHYNNKFKSLLNFDSMSSIGNGIYDINYDSSQLLLELQNSISYSISEINSIFYLNVFFEKEGIALYYDISCSKKDGMDVITTETINNSTSSRWSIPFTLLDLNIGDSIKITYTLKDIEKNNIGSVLEYNGTIEV